MRLLFELSKEHKTLPLAEIISCLNSENIVYDKEISNENILVIKSDINFSKIQRLAERLSQTFYIDELLFICKPDLKEIEKEAINNKINSKGSIAIKYRNRSTKINSQEIVKTLAKIYTKNRIVNLENPDFEIRVIITDDLIYVGILLSEIPRSRFEKRKVQFRPFFSPISLHPKLARTLVNLSMIKKNEVLLDPFCGTGGILLEAGLIGVNIIGTDIEEKMIEGCKKTLDFYKIKNYKLICSDIGEIKNKIKPLDAVVTDFPYGKSTTTKGEKITQLYIRAFKNISMMLKKGKRAVISLPNKKIISEGNKYFSIIDIHELMVHRSLTRFFVVYEK